MKALERDPENPEIHKKLKILGLTTEKDIK